MTGTEYRSNEEHCPVCDSNLQGDPIPAGTQHFYGATHFSRMIGVEYPYDHPQRYDGVSEWLCPDCGARWGRWSKKVLGEGEYEQRFGG